MKEIWGLTGGIAAGKSLVAQYFVEAGIPVIDADQISRDLSAPGGLAREAIEAEFGTVDRAALREKVFSKPELRKKLEAILHPLIQQESVRLIMKERSPYIVYEASLLVETGRYKDFTGLLVVDAPREVRKNRLVLRDGHTPEMADQILRAQTTDEERRKVATLIFANSGTPDELKKKVLKFLSDRRWLKK